MSYSDSEAQQRAVDFVCITGKCRHKIEWRRIDSFTEEAFCNKCNPKRFYRKNDFEGLSIWALAWPWKIENSESNKI